MNTHRRYYLIKWIYEVRAERLHDIHQHPDHYPPCAYRVAVHHYCRARKRWRNIRGWQ